MAIQFPTSGTGSISANEVLAINLLHRAESVGSNAHYDGTEVGTDGAEVYIDNGAPTTLTEAALVINKAKARLNDHYTRHNGGDATGTYAHKVVDTADTIATADMDTGAAYEATLLAALITLVTELRTDYAAHIANGGGTWHVATDGIHILGGSPTLATAADLAVELNNLKAQYEAHRIYTTGGVHASADTTNVVTAPNAVSTDWDSMLVLANMLKVKINAHESNATVHDGSGGADTANQITGADVAYPANIFALSIALKTSYEAHRASTTYHATADSTNTLGYSSPTTITALIAAAVEIRTDINAHMRFARTSKAARLI